MNIYIYIYFVSSLWRFNVTSRGDGQTLNVVPPIAGYWCLETPRETPRNTNFNVSFAGRWLPLRYFHCYEVLLLGWCFATPIRSSRYIICRVLYWISYVRTNIWAVEDEKTDNQSINQSLFAQICNKITIDVQSRPTPWAGQQGYNGTNSCPK